MSVERHPKTGAPVLLVADGGLQNTLPPSSDPIADWIDLMEVVEGLCPESLAPRASRVGWVYRL
jgi:hypothetical protein